MKTLEISGKKIATHWQSVWGHVPNSYTQLDPQKLIKTWTSDEVPGGWC